MSMPIIQTSENPVSMAQAIVDLLESVALEETALSHILNAEGEKLQRYLSLEGLSAGEILEVNESVTSMVNSVTSLEILLKDKLEFICCNLYRGVEYDCCCEEEIPVPEPDPDPNTDPGDGCGCGCGDWPEERILPEEGTQDPLCGRCPSPCQPDRAPEPPEYEVC